MRIGRAADHGGFAMKAYIVGALHAAGHDVIDFGARVLDLTDDYLDFVIPQAKGVVEGALERGIALCSSGVDAAIVANKVQGVRTAMIE